jgi:phospholipid/cholesterol/gamma-HCH transport system substrate-binding protein
MKRDTINYFAVGLFVLSGLFILLAAIFRLTGSASDSDEYYTTYDNVSGLSPGTRVTYEGYALGQVSAIEPHRSEQGMRYRVTFQVRKGWQIPRDSVARIHADGLLADTVITIDEGSSREFLDPGNELQGIAAVDIFALMGEMAVSFGELNEDTLRPMLESLHHTISKVGGEVENRLPEMLRNTSGLIQRLDRSAAGLSGILNDATAVKTNRVLDNLDAAAIDFRNMTEGLNLVQEDARTLMQGLERLVDGTGPEMQQAVAELHQLLAMVVRYSDGILQNMESTSHNMDEFSRQIRQNPGRLLGVGVRANKEARSD